MSKIILNEKTLEKLMGQYTGYVYQIVKGVSCDGLKKEDMEEIVSDVFFSLWKSQHIFENHTTLKPYLAQIARNKTRNRLREKQNQIVFEEENVLDFICIEEHFSEKEQIEKLRELLDELGKTERQLMLAYYFYGFKLEEIANTMQLPLSTVKSKIYRGRSKLISKFKERENAYEENKSK